MVRPTWFWLFGLVSVVAMALVGTAARDAWRQHPTPAFEADMRALSSAATSRAGSLPASVDNAGDASLSPRLADDSAGDGYAYTQPGAAYPVPDEPFAPASERWEDIATLSASGGHLTFDENARAVAESLQQSLSREQLARSLPLVEEALLQRLGATPAREFVSLVGNYGVYIDEMAARHGHRGNVGNTRAWAVSGDASQQLVQLQDDVFGIEAAASLFRMERQLLALMERHVAQYGDNMAALTAEDINRMQQDYDALYAGTSGP